jgi:hypothetical protein
MSSNDLIIKIKKRGSGWIGGQGDVDLAHVISFLLSITNKSS